MRGEIKGLHRAHRNTLASKDALIEVLRERNEKLDELQEEHIGVCHASMSASSAHVEQALDLLWEGERRGRKGHKKGLKHIGKEVCVTPGCGNPTVANYCGARLECRRASAKASRQKRKAQMAEIGQVEEVVDLTE